MTTDLYSTALWQDGQEVDTDALNNGQRFVRAQLTDQILERRIAGLSNVGFAGTIPELMGRGGTDAPSRFAYAVSPGGAYLRQGSANNKIQLAPGTLLQKIANATGADSTLVPFTFVGTEEFTLTNGDVTSPRVDLLQMKLEYISDTPASVDFQDAVTRAITTVALTATRRRLQCTLSVKAGTPAASPTIPDPDAGYVPVGTVVVGHGWTTGGNAPIFGLDSVDTNNAVVHDQRMPFGVSIYRVDPTAYKLETAWALASVNQVVTASSGTNKMFAHCPHHLGRLIAVDLRTDTTVAAGAVTIGALPNGFASAPSAVYVKGNTFSASAVFANGKRCLLAGIEGAHNPVAGPTVLPSAINAIGVPIWTSGYRIPGNPGGITPGWLAMGVINQTNTTSLGEMSFYLATGL